MAIQSNIQINQDTTLNAYIKVMNPTSHKFKNVLKLTYRVEYLTGVNGLLFKTELNTIDYNNSNIWEEAYTNLKSKFDAYTDV